MLEEPDTSLSKELELFEEEDLYLKDLDPTFSKVIASHFEKKRKADSMEKPPMSKPQEVKQPYLREDLAQEDVVPSPKKRRLDMGGQVGFFVLPFLQPVS